MVGQGIQGLSGTAALHAYHLALQHVLQTASERIPVLPGGAGEPVVAALLGRRSAGSFAAPVPSEPSNVPYSLEKEGIF